MSLLVARLNGAGILIMLGTNADLHRLAVAKELGVHHTLNVQQENPVDFVRSLGDGFGADVVVDCTGISAALQQSLQLVRPNGRIVKIGWGPEPLDFSLDPLVGKGITLQGSFSHTYTHWERALRLLSTGQINLAPVIGGIYPLAQWQEAFTKMEEGENVKSVLAMDL
jgi:alcohol dehydrogenase/L-iditol 2-dehydrogenase